MTIAIRNPLAARSLDEIERDNGIRQDFASASAGWRNVAASMAQAEPRRSLWAPQNAPMTTAEYIICTALAIVGVGIFVLFWAGSPA